MAKKVNELPVSYSFDANTVFLAVTNPTGLANTVQIPASVLFGNNTLALVTTNSVKGNNFVFTSVPTTPGSSAQVVAGGTFWYDANYLYLAVSNNNIKRVALSTF